MAVAPRFDRKPPPGWDAQGLAEPYRSLYLILADVWEQLEIAKLNFEKHAIAKQIIGLAQGGIAHCGGIAQRASKKGTL